MVRYPVKRSTSHKVYKSKGLEVKRSTSQKVPKSKGLQVKRSTSLNVELLHRLKNNKHIKQSWSWNGRVFGSTSDGRKVQFDPFDCIEDKITSTDN